MVHRICFGTSSSSVFNSWRGINLVEKYFRKSEKSWRWLFFKFENPKHKNVNALTFLRPCVHIKKSFLILSRYYYETHKNSPWDICFCCSGKLSFKGHKLQILFRWRNKIFHHKCKIFQIVVKNSLFMHNRFLVTSIVKKLKFIFYFSERRVFHFLKIFRVSFQSEQIIIFQRHQNKNVRDWSLQQHIGSPPLERRPPEGICFQRRECTNVI